MAITYLHTCIVCSNSYSDQQNTQKAEATCPTCLMMPSVSYDTLMDEDRLDTITIPNDSPLIFTKDRDGGIEKERLKSGLTGQRVIGKANPHQNNLHCSHTFKRKSCSQCKKSFKPTGGRDIFCDECKPLTVKKTASIRKFVARDKDKNYSGQPIKKPTKYELKKLADGLITEASPEIDRIELMPTEDFPVGLTQVKKQENADCKLDGYWQDFAMTGTTKEGYPYKLARNIIDGRVCIDVYKKTGKERFLSQ